MNSVILIKSYESLPFNEREILRYAGCGKADDELKKLMSLCIDEAKSSLSYRACYRLLPLKVIEDTCDFGVFKARSKKLAVNLKGCDSVVVFAATVGVGIDRLIAKYGRISPSKALMLQAIGAERIETLCDKFCDDIEAQLEKGLRPRFSPGYGDLALETQKDIFSVLDCEKRIGLTLNDSLLMSPSKSVTAFVGVSDCRQAENKAVCGDCNKKDCIFRKGNL